MNKSEIFNRGLDKGVFMSGLIYSTLTLFILLNYIIGTIDLMLIYVVAFIIFILNIIGTIISFKLAKEVFIK